MSVLFYRRPDYMSKPAGAIDSTQCETYVKRAHHAGRAIPKGLSYDDVMENKALPPCSLNDFMDYLIYIEHNAENLQFIIWYKDYSERFEKLSAAEKALCPEYIPPATEPTAKDADHKPVNANRHTIAGMMERGAEGVGAEFFFDDKEANPTRRGSAVKDSASMVGSTVSDATTLTTAEVTAQAGLKWEAYSVAPGRDEVNRVMRHYLAFDSPRELNLSHKDRAFCLHAVQNTTHPSAFGPAVRIAEAALRGQSHPNFIRWSICNGNKPKIVFVRTLGVVHVVAGFVIGILLALSKANRWYRLLPVPVMFVGLSTLIAAYKGLCIILHHTHVRNLHPWEQASDAELELAESRRISTTSTTNPMVSAGDKETAAPGAIKPINRVTFGPKNNSFSSATWVGDYEKKPLISKIFEKSVWTQDASLRLLQDKIVLGANLWALFGTVLYAVLFCGVPNGNFY